MKNIKEIMLYMLLLVPTITELLESGTLPTEPRDFITDIVMTFIVLIMILGAGKKKKVIKQLREEITYIETIDSLTSLPMWSKFNEDLNCAIQSARERKMNLHLACIDIDHFKSVNENYGSIMGDEILKKLVQAIISIVPEGRGHLYRLGGDSFALLFSEEEEKDVARMVSDLATLNACSKQLLESYQSSVTVGTAKFLPHDKDREFWQRAVQNMREKRRKSGQKTA